MKGIIAMALVLSPFLYAKSWDCRYFDKVGKEYFKHGICALNIMKDKEKDYLIISMPQKKDLKKSVLLQLDLLTEGKSYTDEEGRGHWTWNGNPNNMTLNGSIGDNGVTPHCWLKDGKLTLIDKGK